MTRTEFARFFRRSAKPLLIVYCAFVAFVFTHEFFAKKFFTTTGQAEWIWESHRISSGDPVVFFATRDFDLPANPPFVKIRVSADPEYTLFFNGEEIGGGVAGSKATLDVYDVTARARSGRNRIVAALRSANGVGGFLLSVDYAPERQNAVVTDKSWRLYSQWSDVLPSRDVAGLPTVPMLVIGKPPVGRWNELERVEKKIEDLQLAAVRPLGQFDYRAPVREIRPIDGVAVASMKWRAAEGFDFGEVRNGRGKITAGRPDERVVIVRYANDPSELTVLGETRSFVFAKGETTVVDPAPRKFRYMGVYERDAAAEVLLPQPQVKK